MSPRQTVSLIIGGALWALFWLTSMGFAAGTLPATLEWTNPDTVNQIRVDKAPSIVAPFVKLTEMPALTTTYTDATNGSGDTACYKIAYFNGSGIGPYAGPVCKIFPTVPNQSPAAFTVK